MSHGNLIATSNNVFILQVAPNAAHYVFIWDSDNNCVKHGPHISENVAETLWWFVDPDGDYTAPNHTVETELWDLFAAADACTDDDPDGHIADSDPWVS
jgi:hypothetical protein